METYTVELAESNGFAYCLPHLMCLLGDLSQEDRRKTVKSIQGLFGASLNLKKLSGHLDNHPAVYTYKATVVIYPSQLPSLPLDIANYTAISALDEPSAELLDEWSVYKSSFRTQVAVPGDLTVTNLAASWKCLHERFPSLSAVAHDAIWLPVSSVDAERSFLQEKQTL